MSRRPTPKVILKLNKKLDVWNCLNTLWQRCVFGKQWVIDSELAAKLRRKSGDEVKQLVKEFADNKYKKESKEFKLTLKNFQASWHAIEKKYFKRLEKTLQKPICAKKFYAYLTTLSARCPWFYGKKAWMVFYKRPLKGMRNTCAHELLHMQFRRWHERICLKYLNPGQKEHLREALTFLLNEKEFSGFGFVDKGYPAHQKLRAKLSAEWRKVRDFNKFLPKAIEITKRVMK